MFHVSRIVRLCVVIFSLYIVHHMYIYIITENGYLLKFVNSNASTLVFQSSNFMTQFQPVQIDRRENETYHAVPLTTKSSNEESFFKNDGILFNHDLRNERDFTRCFNTKRPDGTDILRKDFKWQYFIDGNKTFYYQGIYYDNRQTEYNLKVFPILGVPLGQVPVDGNVSALLWFEGLQYPFSVPVIQLKTSYRDFRHTNGTIYGNAFQEIELPTERWTLQKAVPHYVSFSKQTCPEYLTTYLPVVFPVPVSNSPKGVLICPKNLYGNLTHKSIPLFVNWFEFLKFFGVTTVHMPYSGLKLEDGHIQNMFNYYIKSGFLTSFHYSPDNLFHRDVHEVDTMAFSDINDCFYRNLNRYKYVIHQDTDEIIVPRKYQTYDEAIIEFLRDNNQNTTNIAHCGFRVYAALHYLFNPAGNPEQPEFMPVLRQTLRQPTSIWGQNKKNPGGSKTIAVMANVVKLDAHAVWGTDTSRALRRVGEERMLVHHYRSECRTLRASRCALEVNEAYHDDVIVRNFAATVTPRVEHVLRQLGYFDWSGAVHVAVDERNSSNTA